jgi:hypothetical protein
MSDYTCKTRTNYFRVTDEDQFKEFMSACVGDGNKVVKLIDRQRNGITLFAFCLDGKINGLRYKIEDGKAVIALCEDEAVNFPEFDVSWDLLHRSLQSVLPDGEAIIITEIGAENTTYLLACCTVITRNKVEELDFEEKELELARSMLGNPAYTTEMDY